MLPPVVNNSVRFQGSGQKTRTVYHCGCLEWSPLICNSYCFYSGEIVALFINHFTMASLLDKIEGQISVQLRHIYMFSMIDNNIPV